jgi:hypothetical protein
MGVQSFMGSPNPARRGSYSSIAVRRRTVRPAFNFRNPNPLILVQAQFSADAVDGSGQLRPPGFRRAAEAAGDVHLK